MCYVLHVHKPLVFIHDIFIIVTRLVWCLFVCLFVRIFCKWCDLCVGLVCMNLNINYSTSNTLESQQLQSTWH